MQEKQQGQGKLQADLRDEETRKEVTNGNGKSKAPKKDAKPTAATTKLLEQLREVSTDIARLEALKQDRTALIAKATEQKVPTATIAEAAGLSVARLRQVQAKAKK
jgi:hypothetical protein